jgi:hypothetical protein
MIPVLNNTPQDITFEEGISHIRFVKGLVGEERLSREFQIIKTRLNQIKKSSENAKNKFPQLDYEKMFQPLFYLLWKTEMHLEDCMKNGLFTPTNDFTRLSALGDNLITLSSLNTEGLDDKISILMSSNHDLFDKTIYEIQIAARHARRRHSVKFVQTESTTGTRSPDLLVDNFIEIECKKKDHSSKQDVRNKEYWNQIARKAFRVMDYVGHNYSIIIKSEKHPTASDVKFVTINVRSLLEDLKEGTFSYPDRGIDIILQKLLPLHMEVLSNTLEHKTTESFDYFLFPAQIMRTEDGKTLVRNDRFCAFKTNEIPGRIKSITYSIKQAIGQMTEKVPGLIYVDLSGIVHSMTERDFERLYRLIKDILRNNSSISMITLTAEFIGSNELGVYRYDRLWPFENEHAKHRLPDTYRVGRD